MPLPRCVIVLNYSMWRLSVQTDSSSSLWHAFIDKLLLDHTEATRFSLCKIWHSNRQGIVHLTEQKIREKGRKGNNSYVDVKVEIPVSKTDGVILTPDLSLLLPQRPNTRGNQVKYEHWKKRLLSHE
jgi:hypothetical protein